MQSSICQVLILEAIYKEGMASVINDGSAFINPEARFSRDISIAFAKSFAGRSARILDPTAATGMRGIRYMLEAKSKDVTFLEINETAFKNLEKNITLNKLKAVHLNESIQEFANTNNGKFDIIDLDPFGSPAPYIYDLMKISRSSTYIMATATDTAVLCGAHAGACLRVYDAKPIHSEICHEIGIRILIGYIARVAAQFDYGIEVLLAFSHRHYMRAMLQLHHGAGEADKSLAMLGHAYQCTICNYHGYDYGMFPKAASCPSCGSRLDIGGRLWLGSIYNKRVISKIIGNLEAHSEAWKLMHDIYDEADIPLFYSVPKMTKRMGISAVSPTKLIECLKESGFIATLTHMQESAIRTNSSIEHIESCIRALYRKQ